VTVPLIERFRDRLPIAAEAAIVSMGEGSTPLIYAPRLSNRLGVEVWLKLESMNPTGSFKDRGMTVAVSKAVADGAQAVICASTGNTAASAAAYAARAGLMAVILQPAGAVALGKLAQARAVGARVLEVRGSFDQALTAARELGQRGTHALVNSVNPHRIQGQKTAAFEIAEALGRTPDVLALPYGGGGNTVAYATGFGELRGSLPRMVAGEAAERATTLASAIRITEPVHQQEAEVAIARSGGQIVSLADDAVIAAWRELAQSEGVFCEPSSAASLAALEQSPPQAGSCCVCVITGHGLKDPATVERSTPPPIPVDPDPDAIVRAARS
jgi:threonine synthase